MNNKFIGHRGEADNPSAVILKNNNLHIEILKDSRAFSAQQDHAGISDIILRVSSVQQFVIMKIVLQLLMLKIKLFVIEIGLGLNERRS